MREIAEFGEAAGERGLVAAIEIGHRADIVGRSERAEFDLDELRRREFEFVLGLGRGVMTIALAEPADRVDGEFLLALQPDAGAGGESENVLGLELAPGTGVLGVCRAALPQARRRARAQSP